MIGILISAAILAGALYLVARHDADISFPKVIGLSAVVAIVTLIGINTIGLFALPLVLLGLGWALIRFCYVSIPQAAIVCGIWLVAQIGLGILLNVMTGR